jgi:hypothetical protein
LFPRELVERLSAQGREFFSYFCPLSFPNQFV